MCKASKVCSWEEWHWALRRTQAWAGTYGQSRSLPVWHEQVKTPHTQHYFWPRSLDIQCLLTWQFIKERPHRPYTFNPSVDPVWRKYMNYCNLCWVKVCWTSYHTQHHIIPSCVEKASSHHSLGLQAGLLSWQYALSEVLVRWSYSSGNPLPPHLSDIALDHFCNFQKLTIWYSHTLHAVIRQLSRGEQGATVWTSLSDACFLSSPSINHYHQRLKSLYFKKKFAERVAEVKPKIKGTVFYPNGSLVYT